jgi:hypothetical protein
VYNEAAAVANEFHVRELDRAELKALLDTHFPQQAWHAQRVIAHSALWLDAGTGDGLAFDAMTARGVERRDAPAAPMYFVVVCAAAAAVLPALPALSLFDDGALSLLHEFERATLYARQLGDARRIAEERLAELVVHVNALASERQKTGVLESALKNTRTQLAKTQADFFREAAAHQETRARLAFRETLPGWVRWPLGVARRRLIARSS